jgi:hypothetical protein
MKNPGSQDVIVKPKSVVDLRIIIKYLKTFNWNLQSIAAANFVLKL